MHKTVVPHFAQVFVYFCFLKYTAMNWCGLVYCGLPKRGLAWLPAPLFKSLIPITENISIKYGCQLILVISLQYSKTSAPTFFAVIWQRHYYLACNVGSGYQSGGLMEKLHLVFLKKVYTIEHSFKTMYAFPSYNFKKLNHKIYRTQPLQLRSCNQHLLPLSFG